MKQVLTQAEVETHLGPVGRECRKRLPGLGLIPVRLLPNGYILRGAENETLFLGGGLFDEIVTVDGIGMLNVSRIHAMIAEGKIGGPLVRHDRMPIDESLLRVVQDVEVDEPVVTGMSAARIEEPCLVLETNGEHRLIDGRHRLERRRREGRPDLPVTVVDGGIVAMVRVFVYTRIFDLWTLEG